MEDLFHGFNVALSASLRSGRYWLGWTGFVSSQG
jgi:hypothetical protein